MEREEPVTIQMATLPNIKGLFFSVINIIQYKLRKKIIPCKYVVATKEEEAENCWEYFIDDGTAR
jgi:hypothetical protein